MNGISINQRIGDFYIRGDFSGGSIRINTHYDGRLLFYLLGDNGDGHETGGLSVNGFLYSGINVYNLGFSFRLVTPQPDLEKGETRSRGKKGRKVEYESDNEDKKFYTSKDSHGIFFSKVSYSFNFSGANDRIGLSYGSTSSIIQQHIQNQWTHKLGKKAPINKNPGNTYYFDELAKKS